ncbi:MAG TPA: glycosyltransferase family 4 protein [Phycisphaerae bacterium]|nr:glycosyltransferase family 4 protein [Phycisphaerae bacterium]HNU46421.1 glycosyltransferase family 4 protein [Phycisphaerae bacterium]
MNQDKPTIAHIVTTRASAATMFHLKLAGLSRRGYRQWVVAANDGYPMTPPAGVTLVDVPIPRPISPGRDLSALCQLVRFLRRHRPDIVHTRTSKAGFLGRLAGRLAGVPVVIHTVHGLPYYDGQRRVAYHGYKRLEQLAGRWADYVLSQNQYDYRRLFQEHVVPRSRVGYEGNGVDLAALRPYRDPAVRMRMRDKLGMSPEQVLCVMLCRFERVKRVDRLLEAVARTRAPNLRFLISGGGREFPLLEATAARLGILDKVTFSEWRRDTLDIIAASDVNCLTSEKEGLPRSLMEALAIGRAIVATDVPGTNEVVSDQETGLLVPPDDIAGLAAALDGLAADPSLRRQMGEAGIERAERLFDEEDVEDRLELVYAQLLQGIRPSLEPPA